MKHLIAFAVVLAALVVLSTCGQAATPLERFVQERPTLGVHAILKELRGQETAYTTNAVPARARSAAEKQIVADAVPLLTSKNAWRNAQDKDAHLDAQIRHKLDGTGGFTAAANLAETRRIVAILTTRAAIAREGRSLSGDDDDEPQPPVVTETKGLPLWQRIGLAAEPEPEEVRRAMESKP